VLVNDAVVIGFLCALEAKLPGGVSAAQLSHGLANPQGLLDIGPGDTGPTRPHHGVIDETATGISIREGLEEAHVKTEDGEAVEKKGLVGFAPAIGINNPVDVTGVSNRCERLT
jgi:hypothetical protein